MSVYCFMSDSTTVIAVGSAKYGEGSGDILLDDLECGGGETSLARCDHAGIFTHNCHHSEDVGVICSISMYISNN